MARMFALMTVLVLSLVLSVGAAIAQDASPTAGECVAPELPPGTPTPMEEPSADEAASPAAEGEAGGDGEAGPQPPAYPENGSLADEATAAEAIAAAENVIACLNSGDYLGVAALVTEDFMVNFLDVPTVYDVPMTFEGAGPMETLFLDNAQTYAEGWVSVDFVYSGFFSGPTGVTAERWYFAEEDGIWKVAGISPISLPDGVLTGATEIEVVMVDFAFYVEPKTVPAGQPVVFHVVNQAESTTRHVAVLLSYPEGTTAEQLIAGDVSVMDATTGFFGAIYLEPGQSGDLAFTSLEAGTYFFGCDVETEHSHLHFELGMVSQITVE